MTYASIKTKDPTALRQQLKEQIKAKNVDGSSDDEADEGSDSNDNSQLSQISNLSDSGINGPTQI